MSGSLLVVIICYLGSVLPIWRWAQPINYVAFWIVFMGILGGILGLLIWRPGMGDFPVFTKWTIGIGPLWPMLFVTIACGAISGWHSLVSSSGTARQLEKETDALYVGGGAMFLEMVFACVAFLTATVAFGSFEGYVKAGGGAAPAKVFSIGLATFMNQWGLPMVFGTAYGAVFLTLMALTIMYLVVRFMRVASAEALGDRIPVYQERARRHDHRPDADVGADLAGAVPADLGGLRRSQSAHGLPGVAVGDGLVDVEGEDHTCGR